MLFPKSESIVTRRIHPHARFLIESTFFFYGFLKNSPYILALRHVEIMRALFDAFLERFGNSDCHVRDYTTLLRLNHVLLDIRFGAAYFFAGVEDI